MYAIALPAEHVRAVRIIAMDTTTSPVDEHHAASDEQSGGGVGDGG